MVGNTFEKNIVLLMQSKLMHTPLKDMSVDESEAALEVVLALLEDVSDETCSRYDCIQMARLYFNAAELANKTGEKESVVAEYYRSALCFLTEGGFDLSIHKWLHLINIKPE